MSIATRLSPLALNPPYYDCSDVIGDLSSCQTHGQWSAFTIANGMEFGVQPAFCAPDMAGKNPPFKRLDAVR